MGQLFAGYEPARPLGISAYDEMIAADGTVRRGYTELGRVLDGLDAAAFDARCVARDRSFRDQGITFSLSGEERPFPLDLIPRIITPDEWSLVQAGVIQRVLAAEAFLADVYGEGAVFHDGIVPRRTVQSSPHFHREAAGITPLNGVRIHVSGIDLVRYPDGQLAVLEDNLRTPSGISYVIENRRAMARVFPELFAEYRVRPVSGYPAKLLESLRAAAPASSRAQPTVVLLTPGVYNSAYFEHSFLARQMGIELVEGRDLIVRDQTVYMRTTEGEQRVDVIYRRVDDEWLDPQQFRPESIVGCPGLLNAARAGNVTIANAVGNGVADDKLTYTYMPDLIKYYLDEKPILPNVATYRLEDPDVAATVLDRLDELVVKPVDASGGYGLVVGPSATDQQLAELRAKIIAEPRHWIAQEVIALSSSPTWTKSGMQARHIDLRPFAVNDGTNIWVVPGGLSRVALVQGSLVVNSSQGGGSKDTWVLAPNANHTALES
jgi:uncharacterized circularly permuted ATP-grasp superfamily protein